VNNLPLSSLFVDFDAYFASAEQHLVPRLRGKPVAVVPVLAETSCCIAASYKAKAHGIKTGTSVRDARTMCPNIQIVEARPARYIELHHQLVAAVESCIHVEAVLSIDEMWCWLPYNLRQINTTKQIARKIKSTIAQQVSPWIKASIGIAPNKWLAKMASKMRKPDGLLVIEHHLLPEILYDLKLRDIHGVGHAMELRLHAHGIHDVRSLCCATRHHLHSAWGSIEGDRLWLQLRGKEIPELTETTRQSIGHSHVIPPDKRHPSSALPILHKLTQKAAQRLRSHGMLTRKFHLSIRYLRGGVWSQDLLLEATDDSLTLARTATTLWKKRPNHTEPLLKISMVLEKLILSNNYTPSLFSKQQNLSALNASMDQITQKFGHQSLYLGGAHHAINSAPMRISFGHIPKLTPEPD